jgi:hypothetical protein
MNLAKKIISVAAGVALVAGMGAVAAAPAQAKTKYSGTTTITFNSTAAALFASVVAVPPAKVKGAKISFPVTKVKGDTVEHKGGLQVGALEVSSPYIIIGENNTASVTVDAGLPMRVELFVLKNFKMTKKSKKKQVWKGDVHLTSNPLVVGVLNEAAGAEVFTADMALGAINTLIKIKK